MAGLASADSLAAAVALADASFDALSEAEAEAAADSAEAEADAIADADDVSCVEAAASVFDFLPNIHQPPSANAATSTAPINTMMAFLLPPGAASGMLAARVVGGTADAVDVAIFAVDAGADGADGAGGVIAGSGIKLGCATSAGAGAGAETGAETGAGAAAAAATTFIPAPHLPQNFAPGLFGVAHTGHALVADSATGAATGSFSPQPLQNLT